MVPQTHIHRCMGQMVICHTRNGDIHGRLVGCNGTHLTLHVPRYGLASGGVDPAPSAEISFGDEALKIIPASYPQAYGYGFGYGRTVVALAAVVGLTAIGVSALWW